MRTACTYWAITLTGILMAAFGHTASAEGKDTKPQKPPNGAIILFDGKDTSAWVHRGTGEPCTWTVANGAMEINIQKPDLLTKQEFGDFRLYLEFNIPNMPDKRGQGRGNSGVYLQGRYEIQILDSYQNDTYPTGACGAIYGQKAPDTNAAKPPGEWQTYDITFRAARFDTEGKLLARPRVTVLWNGVKVHDDVEITLDVGVAGVEGKKSATGPILLQNHGSKIKFRNIWILPLDSSK